MNRNELALARPRHILDLCAYGAHLLAVIGDAALAGAAALNRAASARPPLMAETSARRGRRADRSFERGRHGVPDSWHVR